MLRGTAAHVLALLRPFWWDSERATRGEAFLRLACVVVMLFARTRVTVWASRLRSRQLKALATGVSGDGHDLLRPLLQFAFASAVSAPVNKLNFRLRRGLRLQWTIPYYIF